MTEIRFLGREQTLERLEELSEVLSDCVHGGASVSFMLPFAMEEARDYWRGIADAAGEGDTLLAVALHDSRVAGTVQVGMKQTSNQPHRGDLKKLLVHRAARGLGLSRLLMEAAERKAAEGGKTLLVLDTATGSPAEAIYPRFGWTRVGVVPDYALYPDGSFCGTTFFYKRIA
ncbi:GNAT family N-acetyltransferase [Rhizobiaceae bacterium BDR2-2]|uniref:GNAT family N-acetyltransferase n=1 Tax=Ectorhizobium quercum TaxID=2965071 RepID=A0AAE3SX17_9HYPH|nr:GNAT family N-acetyltransferase [Ectorhizobium quercum]MCX8998005.1 GNAT family N-acetyltransferase [Ectorhizobium quercum]